MRELSLLAFAALLSLASCDEPTGTGSAQPPLGPGPPATDMPGNPLGLPAPAAFAAEHADFTSYWHQGVAELTRYRLRQVRYGEVHDGEAVLIFVTEPFLPDLQVKHESGDHPEAIEVLKLNAHRRFYTGIYPYSVLTSTFSPTSGAPTLKASCSVQEWCGHAYTQLNRRGAHLELDAHSYFQAEADQERQLPDAPLEDGIYATLRRDPSAAPTGPVSIVPALHHLRFVHAEVRPYRARGSLEPVDDERFGTVLRYTLDYAELERTLRVYVGLAHPHVVYGWEEDVPGGTTEAVRTRAILTDYWNHNGAGDGAYRDALGLTM